MFSVLLAARGVWGGPPDPSTDPALNDPSVQESIVEQQRRRGMDKPMAPEPAPPGQRAVPVVPEVPGSAPGEPAKFDVTKGRVYPEGTFLVGRAGAVVRATSDDYVFVPAPRDGREAPAERDAPLVLLPGQKLAQLAGACGSASVPTVVTLSGQVFTYNERMYLLPTAFTIGAEGGTPGAGANQGTPATRPSAGADPRVDELIKRLESARAGPRLMDASNLPKGRAPTEPNARDARGKSDAVMPEGTVLTNRRGRLVRSGGGDLLFSFDNDPSSPGTPAMPLLPCRMLQHLEELAAVRGDALTFRLSGRVTAYHGKNYLLPTMFQTIRPGDINSLQ